MPHSRFRLHRGEFADFGVHARHCERETCRDTSQKRKNEHVIDEEELQDEIMKASTLIDEFTISRKTADTMISKVKAARTCKTHDPTMSINSSATKPKGALKLPRIELSKISGNYSE